MRISPGARQLQHPALPRHQFRMILLNQLGQARSPNRRQIHPRIEHTFTLDESNDRKSTRATPLS